MEGSQATIDYTAETHFIGTVMSEPQSVTQWLQGARAGQDDAFQRLWERYYEQLVALARRRQGRTPRRMPAETPLVAAKQPRLLWRSRMASWSAAVSGRMVMF